MNTPEEILNIWMKAVNNGDLDTLMGLYHENAILIPTFSNRILNTRAKILDYFEKLSKREELCVALHEKTVSVHEITSSVFAMSGIYCWRFEVDEEMLSFEARFSFVLDLNSSQPIVQHHSSQIPRML